MGKGNKLTKVKSEEEVVVAKQINVIIATVVLGLLLTAFVVYMFGYTHRQNFVDDLWSELRTAIISYESMIDKDGLYQKNNEEFVEDLAAYASFYIEKHGFTNGIFEEIVTDVGRYSYIYFYSGSIDRKNHQIKGQLIRDPRNISDEEMDVDLEGYRPLDDAQLYELFDKGRYQDGKVEYTAKEVKDKGYVIFIWSAIDILQNQSVMNAFTSERDEEMLRVNIDTGIIEDASITDLIGKECDEHILMSGIKELRDGEVVIKVLENGVPVYLITEEVDNQLFIAYVDCLTTNINVIRSVALPIILGWLFLIMVLVYVLRLVKKEQRNRANIEYIRIFGKHYVGRKLIGHVNGIVFFSVILIVISMIYVQTLINYSNQNINAKKDLNSLGFMINLNKSNIEAMKEDYDFNQRSLADAVANYYLRFPEELDTKSLQAMKAKMPNVYNIVVYDGNGVCEYDSGGGSEEYAKDSMVGYTLSSDENLEESVGWDILKGNIEHANYNKDNYEEYYEMRRRLDKDGLIVIETAGKNIGKFEEMSSIDSVVKAAYFGEASRIYIDNNNPDTLVMYEPGKNVPINEKHNLPEEVLTDGYAGVTRIDGVKSYVSTKECKEDNLILMSSIYAFSLGGMYSPFILIAVIVIFFLQSIVVLFTMSERFEQPPIREVKRSVNIQVKETIDEQLMDDRFRKVVRDMFYSTCIMILLLLGADSLFGRMSLLGYLFSNEWAKGVNLFSVTIILMMIAGAIIGGGILQSLVLFFTKNMGPRGATIGRMVSSIIKFLILIAVFFSILIDIGFDPSVLITGAGIAGALISFSAQQTVNDFLSGFFIVFEGLFNIGDWITVNGFRGQVIEIGIRTTKIAIGGNVQIVNNSELKTITLMAPNGTGAICEVDIAYKEDIDRVIEIIKDNASKYLEEIPAIVEGPFVDGVVDLGASGVTLYLWALADQEKVKLVERDMRRVTKDLFDANNIEIPFNQVTIHTANYVSNVEKNVINK